MTYQTEVHRRVYDNDNGCHLTVQPSPDFPGNVMLHAEDSQKEWFGAVRLDLPAAYMRLLGQALIDAAGEEEGKQ